MAGSGYAQAMVVNGAAGPGEDLRRARSEGTGLVQRTGLLRFQPEPPPTAAHPNDGRLIVVLDTTWTAAQPDPTSTMAPTGTEIVGLREVVASILAERDPFAEAFVSLDDWAARSGIVGILDVEGTSFWYGARLEYWMWLLDVLLWLAVVDRALTERGDIGVIECAPGSDAGLAQAAQLIAARDSLVVVGAGTDPLADDSSAGDGGAPSTAAPAPAPARRRSLIGRVRWRLWPPLAERRRRAAVRRLGRLASDPARRLLVVQAHVRQRIDTPSGPRLINAYLGPVIDRLRGTRLEPIQFDLAARVTDEVAWARLTGPEGGRTLPTEALSGVGPAITRTAAKALAAAVVERVVASRTPLGVAGVDLGPALTERIAERTRRTAFLAVHDVPRIRALLRRLHPAGVLLADEYHRQDWLAAAAAEGVPTAAVQHGVIYRWHTGYIHRSRPAELRLAERTYVFGAWERALLTERSAYRADEVRVAGSPRLDLVDQGAVDHAAVRRELGVADGARLVVLSGTWGPMYRRFHYPIALAALFDRPIPGVHLVIKLHPAERDEGPYRAVIERRAAAGGFEPPPISVVQSIDLYRLLGAADAHLGIHSTVLTEAVVIGTPNLLASGLVAADLLDYVAAGVALPVRDGADLIAALQVPREEAMGADARAAFLAAHYEPGPAGQRIADDLLAWMR